MLASAPASKRYADVRDWVFQVDPELAEAEADVDVTLLEAASQRSPFECLDEASRLAQELRRLRDLPRR